MKKSLKPQPPISSQKSSKFKEIIIWHLSWQLMLSPEKCVSWYKPWLCRPALVSHGFSLFLFAHWIKRTWTLLVRGGRLESSWIDCFKTQLLQLLSRKVTTLCTVRWPWGSKHDDKTFHRTHEQLFSLEGWKHSLMLDMTKLPTDSSMSFPFSVPLNNGREAWHHLGIFPRKTLIGCDAQCAFNESTPHGTGLSHPSWTWTHERDTNLLQSNLLTLQSGWFVICTPMGSCSSSSYIWLLPPPLVEVQMSGSSDDTKTTIP